MMPYETERRAVIDAACWLSDRGYFGTELSAGGNISVRIAKTPNIAITPSGRPYAGLTPEAICILNAGGKTVNGDFAPSIESGMHLGIYRNRPDIGAVVHTHQPFASVLAVVNRPIPALFDEVTLALGRRIAVIPYALSGTPELVARVVETVQNGCNAFIMQNHGALCLGATLEKAMKNAELLEKVAKVYCRALAIGEVSELPEATLRRFDALRGIKEGI